MLLTQFITLRTVACKRSQRVLSVTLPSLFHMSSKSLALIKHNNSSTSHKPLGNLLFPHILFWLIYQRKNTQEKSEHFILCKCQATVMASHMWIYTRYVLAWVSQRTVTFLKKGKPEGQEVDCIALLSRQRYKDGTLQIVPILDSVGTSCCLKITEWHIHYFLYLNMSNLVSLDYANWSENINIDWL